MNKEEILGDLTLIKDEPAQNLMFGFQNLVTQMFNVLTNKKIDTPLVIAIHGEWGGGKTSLINAIYSKINLIQNNKECKILKFDAWEYERTDIVVALLQQISAKYDSNTSKKFVKSSSSFIVDAILRKTAGMSKDDAENHFKEFVKHISTVRENLEELIGNNRLIVFVDDLDRCNVDNVLNMLEAIKMFLTAKGVIFVVAVDMDKIEKAWHLRYNNPVAANEGRNHIEKIFQLKLSLPIKSDDAMDAFAHNLFPRFLTPQRRDLLVSGCKRNPRNIKRILNLVYFTILGLPETENLEDEVILVISWCVLVSSFPELAKKIRENPMMLLGISFVCCLLTNLRMIISDKKQLEKEIINKINITDPTLLKHIFDPDLINSLLTIKTNDDHDLFEFLRAFGKCYNFHSNASRDERFLIKRIDTIMPHLVYVVNYNGFTGI